MARGACSGPKANTRIRKTLDGQQGELAVGGANISTASSYPCREPARALCNFLCLRPRTRRSWEPGRDLLMRLQIWDGLLALSSSPHAALHDLVHRPWDRGGVLRTSHLTTPAKVIDVVNASGRRWRTISEPANAAVTRVRRGAARVGFRRHGSFRSRSVLRVRHTLCGDRPGWMRQGSCLRTDSRSPSTTGRPPVPAEPPESLGMSTVP